MISGISDTLAGAITAVIEPNASRSARYTTTGAAKYDDAASPRPITPAPIAHSVVRVRRSLRSTSAPTGTNSRTTGRTWIAPTAAMTYLLPVRS
jgi:hypothetical protein